MKDLFEAKEKSISQDKELIRSRLESKLNFVDIENTKKIDALTANHKKEIKKINTTHQKQIAKFEVNTKQLSYNENLSRKTAEQLLIETKELRTLLSSMKRKLIQ